MATVQDTNEQLAITDRLLEYARTALLKSDDGLAYSNLSQCLSELATAQLYVVESEVEGMAYKTANDKLNVAAIYLRDAVYGLLGRTHTAWVQHATVEQEPDRQWIATQVAACRIAILEADNTLMLDLLSREPLTTHQRLVGMHTSSDYPPPHYETGHE